MREVPGTFCLAGFDFLGYHLTPADLAPATQTIQNFLQRIARLYEQGADMNRIGQYVRHWLVWLRSGVGKRVDIGYFALADGDAVVKALG